MRQFVRIAIGFSVGTLLASFVVNLITGPGTPTILSGQPVLVSQWSTRPTTWTVWWLNRILTDTGWLSIIWTIFIIAFLAMLKGTMLAAPRRRRVVYRERYLSGQTTQARYSHGLTVRLADGMLDFHLSPLVNHRLDYQGVQISLMQLLAVRLERRGGRWWLIGEEESTGGVAFAFVPRCPRRWALALRASGVRVLPWELDTVSLPRLQIGVLLEQTVGVGHLFAIVAIFFGIAVVALLDVVGHPVRLP